MSLRVRAAGIVAGLLAAVALLSPAVAGASSASVSGDGELRFFASAGEANHVSVSLDGTNFVIDDPGSAITPMVGCAAVTANRVTCAEAAVTDRITVELNDLDDQATLAAPIPELSSDAVVVGGAGVDEIVNLSSFGMQGIGEAGNDTITGGPDRDRLIGNDGDDVLVGNAGDDTFDSGLGTDSANGGSGFDSFEGGSVADEADSFIGGPDRDRINYGSRVDPVTITLDGVADDGASGEGDNIGSDIEDAGGGNGEDTLIGNGAENELDGSAGPDTITGNAGIDVLDGGSGNDSTSGGPGDDEIRGSDGADSLNGGDGDDVMSFEFSDAEADQILGGPGLDRYTEYSVLGLKIDLDGVTDDGYRDPLEGPSIDNVGADVEDLFTSSKADDILTGNNSANQIDGGAGDDRINGLGAPDALLGGPGEDHLDGGSGIDQLDGAGGADNLRSRDASPDEVSCGSSSDILLADSLDDFTVTCDQSSTGARLKTKSTKVKKNKALLKVICPAAEGIDCKVKITAKKGKKTLAKGSGKVKSAKTGKVKLKLTKAGKKARSRKLTLRAKTVLTDATGAKVATTRPKLVLRR